MNAENIKKYRMFLVILLYLVAVAVGIDTCFSTEQMQPHTIILSFFLAALMAHLCIIDGKIVEKPLSFFSYFFLFIFFYIAAPICIIRAHGIKQGIKIVLIHIVGLCFTSLIVLLLCEYFFKSGD